MKKPISRRSFLRSSAAAAAVPVVGCAATETGPAAAALAASDRPVLRVGLIGCGGRGTGAAYQALSAEDGGVHLTAMGDVFPDRIQASHESLTAALGANVEEQVPDRTERLDVPAARRFVGFDAYEKVIASGVDVVILTTPPVFRPDHLAAAVRRGLHVFCEKPVAVDAPGVRSVLESAAASKRAGLSLVSGYCWRYNVRHRALYERVLDGRIGDIRAVYSTYNASPLELYARQPGWSEMEWQLRNWQHVQWLSGDHITEQGCHSLDKMAWTFGDEPPLSVTAIGGRQTGLGPETGNLFDHFGATFEYAGGARGFHMSRQMAGCPFDNSDYVYGSRGTATVQGWTPLHRIEGDDPWLYEGEGNDMYQQEHDELFASIRSGKPIQDGEWMAKSTLLAVMLRMSAYTGRTITWEEALASEERLAPEHFSMDAAPALRPRATPGVTPFV